MKECIIHVCVHNQTFSVVEFFFFFFFLSWNMSVVYSQKKISPEKDL